MKKRKAEDQPERRQPAFAYLHNHEEQNSVHTDVQETSRILASQEYLDAQFRDKRLYQENYARLSTLRNLSKPIKLVSASLILKEQDYFPPNNSDFQYTPLDEVSVARCVAVSHRWTDAANSRNDLDVKWLRENWHTFELPKGEDDDVLLFYDYSSLPQRGDDGNFDTPEDYLTFKAGLEIIDHIFANKAIIIPTEGYLFRFWCYAEFFITEYSKSRVSPIPMKDPAPRDLKIMDAAIEYAIQDTQNFLVLALNKEQVRRSIAEQLQGLQTLGWQEKRILSQHIIGFDQYDQTKRFIVQFLLVERGKIAGIIQARFRQCTIRFESDRSFLNNMLNQYLTKQEPRADFLQLKYKATLPGLLPNNNNNIYNIHSPTGIHFLRDILSQVMLESHALPVNSTNTTRQEPQVQEPPIEHERDEEADDELQAAIELSLRPSSPRSLPKDSNQ